MSRNMHTISRFKGVSLTDSVANIPPDSAIDSLNIFADSGGFLSQFQQPSIIWADQDRLFSTLFPIPVSGSDPRLILQSGSTVLFTDFPYASSPSAYAHGILAGLASRLDYALCNGIVYFSNGQDSGYVRPPNPADTAATRCQWGIQPPPAPVIVSIPTGPLSPTTGYQYGACYGASNVGHWSSLSPLSASTGPFTNGSPTVTVAASPDWQVDQVALFRNQDSVVPGGGLWYLVEVRPGNGATFNDITTDEDLATSGQTAPYDNGIAPLGKYLAVWLDRILMCGITGSPLSVRYTGYDSINFGRPQMSWCQFNDIKLGQGQAEPLGMGLLRYGGMVFFGTDGLMYVYRGTLNDITVDAPTSLSFYAEQLPYNIGLYSHFSVQATSGGLVWLDDGFNLRIMDNTGFYPPKLVAPQLTSLFKRITPGSQDRVASIRVSYLQRDWYILTFPIDGSVANNMTVVVDTAAEGATGAWPVNHSISDLIWTDYADRTGHLLAVQSQLNPSGSPVVVSYLNEIPVLSPIVQGIVDPNQLALSPPNLPMPGGFWRSGYFGLHDEQGDDQYSQIKLFRYLRIGSSLAAGLRVQAFLVNGEEWPWDNPATIWADMDGDCGGINQKARCLSTLLSFPDNALISVNSLTMAWVVAGVR